MKVCLLVSSVVFAAVLSISAAQTSETCTDPFNWVGVPENEYDKRFESLNEPDGRPLGFNRSTVPYVTEDKPNPCIRVTETLNKRIEVMAESHPVGFTICVNRQDDTQVCGNTGIYFCEQAIGNPADYVFFCKGTSCDQTDVSFFYRFTVSPPSSEMDPEMWCANRNTGEYPRTLSAPIPPGVTYPQTRSAPPNGATTPYINLLIMLSCIFTLMASLGVNHI